MTEIPVNCLFNKKKTGCGATELAIRNSIPTLIAMPYVALVKNKTVCRTDDIEVLGVYEDITEWDITQFARKDSHDLRLPAACRFRFTEHRHRPLQRVVPAGGRMARAVQLLFVPTPSHPRTACDGGTLRPCDLHDGDAHRAGIHVGGTAPPADLRNRLTRPYGGQSTFAADQQARQIHHVGVRQSPARRIALQPTYLRQQRGFYRKGNRHA